MRKATLEPGRFYHVFNRGNERKNIFFERENYLFFLRRLKQSSEKHKVLVITYCLMPNQFHLILGESKDRDISKLMMSLQISYAKAINKRLNRIGHLFQGPFRNILIDKTEYLLHLSRYIHMNPVLAGITKEPEEWEFSSYRDFIKLRNGKLPATEIILSEFDGIEDYRNFVGEYKDHSTIKNYILE